MSNVVQIGDFSVEMARRWAYRPDRCEHKRIGLEEGDVVRCLDCKTQVSAFWALEEIVTRYNTWTQSFNADRKRHAETVAKELHLTAARDVEKAWRSRSMVPCCPHCRKAIFPQDGFGRTTTNKKLALAQRGRT